MTEPRLASSVQISAFVRLASIVGDFATVLAKGDPIAGTILLIVTIRGKNPQLFERFPSLDGNSSWQTANHQMPENEAEITQRWKSRRLNDPDLWVLELDVASTERLSEYIGTIY